MIAWAQARRGQDGRRYWLVWASSPSRPGHLDCWGAYLRRDEANWTLDALARHGWDVEYPREDAA